MHKWGVAAHRQPHHPRLQHHVAGRCGAIGPEGTCCLPSRPFPRSMREVPGANHLPRRGRGARRAASGPCDSSPQMTHKPRLEPFRTQTYFESPVPEQALRRRARSSQTLSAATPPRRRPRLLQPRQLKAVPRSSTQTMRYDFFCKSLYQSSKRNRRQRPSRHRLTV